MKGDNVDGMYIIKKGVFVINNEIVENLSSDNEEKEEEE